MRADLLVSKPPSKYVILTWFINCTVRAQKSLGLVGGTPDYSLVPGFAVPDVPARTYHYSADGRLYAYALPNV